MTNTPDLAPARDAYPVDEEAVGLTWAFLARSVELELRLHGEDGRRASSLAQCVASRTRRDLRADFAVGSPAARAARAFAEAADAAAALPPALVRNNIFTGRIVSPSILQAEAEWLRELIAAMTAPDPELATPQLGETIEAALGWWPETNGKHGRLIWRGPEGGPGLLFMFHVEPDFRHEQMAEGVSLATAREWAASFPPHTTTDFLVGKAAEEWPT